MTEIVKSSSFHKWLTGLRDSRARARILARLDRLASGNPGDSRPVGKGITELRIDYGPGYRVYYMRRGTLLIILLCGGDKSTQAQDIRLASQLAVEFKE